MLAGCGFADIRSPVPEFMRAKAPDPPPLEAPPDIKTMLREKLDAVFTQASQRRCASPSLATICVDRAGLHASRPR